MIRTHSNDDAHFPTGRLPPRLRTLSVIGTIGFAVSLALWGLSFLTNPTPAPYYTWLESPARLPVEQPRIGHYPASWTVGLWLWEFTFPFVLLLLYDRGSGGLVGLRRWLLAVPVGYMFAFFAYCRWFWPKPDEPWLLEPATNAPCWTYCVTYADAWAAVTASVVGLGVVAWLVARQRPRYAGGLVIGFGLLSLPLGIPALYAGYELVQR